MALDDWYDPELDKWLVSHFTKIKYDAVIAEYFFMSRALLSCTPGTRRLIDTHDIFSFGGSDNMKQQKSAWLWTTSKAELKGLQRADTVLAIQDVEAGKLRHEGLRDVRTVGHFVDINPLEANVGLNSKSILFAGANSRYNVEGLRWFYKEVFPIIKNSISPKQIIVVGNINQALADELPFDFRGVVANLRPIYEMTRVVIAPLRGGTGLKIKIIEALAHGRPLLTTSCGALGLESGFDNAFMVADTEKDFAQKLLLLLSSDNLCQKLMINSVSFVGELNKRHLLSLESALLGKPD